MNILAFLQNPWFKPGTDWSVIEKYRDDQKFHRGVLLGCMSGQRLFAALGGELFTQIHWDNTNWRPAWYAAGREEPDFSHMAEVIATVDPHIVIAFGNQAWDALQNPRIKFPYNWDGKVLRCHHPNARHKTQADLDNFGCELKLEIIRKQCSGSSLHVEDL